MKTFADIAARTLRQGQACQSVHVEPRIEHTDPRERLLMLYGVWVKCLPHQAGRRRLVEHAIRRCKAEIAEHADERHADERHADERLQLEMNGTGAAVSDVWWTRGVR